MISGISAMMKIGNNINNMISLTNFKRDDYFQTSLPYYDKSILRILDKYTGLNTDVCSHITEEMKNLEGESYADGGQTPSENSLFKNTCVLINNDIQHRLLIKKEYPYKMFSCYLKEGESICPYEENKWFLHWLEL